MTRRTVGIGVPEPPEDPAQLDPLIVTLPAGTALVRCHPTTYRPAEFWEGREGGARFSAFSEGAAASGTPAASAGSRKVPVLYAANTADGALSETILHEVPASGAAKRVMRAATLSHAVSRIELLKDVRLADLTSVGLRRLGLSRTELVESDRRFYRDTAAWAKALHAHPEKLDGLLWVSRQHDTSQAMVFFERRISEADFEIATDPGDPDDGPMTLPLGFGPGKDLLDDICDRAGITVVDP